MKKESFTRRYELAEALLFNTKFYVFARIGKSFSLCLYAVYYKGPFLLPPPFKRKGVFFGARPTLLQLDARGRKRKDPDPPSSSSSSTVLTWTPHSGTDTEGGEGQKK